jgi:hypothetical protein
MEEHMKRWPCCGEDWNPRIDPDSQWQHYPECDLFGSLRLVDEWRIRDIVARSMQSSGGQARAAKLTDAQRSEIARKGAAARWKKHADELLKRNAEAPKRVLIPKEVWPNPVRPRKKR